MATLEGKATKVNTMISQLRGALNGEFRPGTIIATKKGNMEEVVRTTGVAFVGNEIECRVFTREGGWYKLDQIRKVR